MIKTLIIEDEKAAAERMKRLLHSTDPDIQIQASLDSIISSVAWLSENPSPDLIILDIQLADGLSFEIFRKVNVDSFIIFTTAYDEYAIKAFELNSIDYLLKPIQQAKLAQSIAKFKKLKSSFPAFDIEHLFDVLENKKSYKERFLVNAGTKIKSINVSDIAYFYSTEKTSFLCTKEDRHYAIEYSLDSLDKMLDTVEFFRINRQFLVKHSALDKIYILSKSRIKIELTPSFKEGIDVSKAKTHEFRNWLDR